MSSSASTFIPETIDATLHEKMEMSNQYGACSAGQLVAHYHSLTNITSAAQPTQPPTTEFQASQPDVTYKVNSRQSRPLNPKATVFVPALLERLYDQHREAYLRQKFIGNDLMDTHDMLMNGEPGQSNFERLEERLRELMHEYVDAGNERAKIEITIEGNYGSAALSGRSKKLSEY